jgi:hypothetical protein
MEILQTHTKLVRNSVVRLKITNMRRNEILKSLFDKFQPGEMAIPDDAYEQEVSTCRILLETIGFIFQQHRWNNLEVKFFP